jgi:hypothetical protein
VPAPGPGTSERRSILLRVDWFPARRAGIGCQEGCATRRGGSDLASDALAGGVNKTGKIGPTSPCGYPTPWRKLPPWTHGPARPASAPAPRSSDPTTASRPPPSPDFTRCRAPLPQLSHEGRPVPTSRRQTPPLLLEPLNRCLSFHRELAAGDPSVGHAPQVPTPHPSSPLHLEAAIPSSATRPWKLASSSTPRRSRLPGPGKSSSSTR